MRSALTLGVPDERACDGDALLLSPAQLEFFESALSSPRRSQNETYLSALSTDVGVVAVGKRHDEVVNAEQRVVSCLSQCGKV